MKKRFAADKIMFKVRHRLWKEYISEDSDSFCGTIYPGWSKK